MRKIEIYVAINDYLNEKSVIGAFSEKTVENRRYELMRFKNFLKSKKIEYSTDIHKNSIISYLKTLRLSNNSKTYVISVLSGFFDYLVDEELILDNPASRLPKLKNYAPKTDYLKYEEIEQIFAAEARNGSKKTVDRNLLLFSLFTDVCMRVSETINLTFEDVRLPDKELWVTRKRNKVDRLPLSENLVDQFLTWYEVRKTYKGADQEWVFLSTHGKQLKPRQVHGIVSKALQRAGIVKRKQGPHLLRHSGASLKAQSGENLIMIQYLLGHENLNTTRRYLHFDWDELTQMVARSPKFKSC